MKKILLIALIAVGTFAVAQTAYVDVDYLIANMPEVKIADEELKTYANQLQVELTAAEVAAGNQFEELKKKAQDTNLSAEEKTGLATKADDLQKGFQRTQKLAELQMAAERNKIMDPIYEKINKAIEKISKDRGYKMVVSVNNVLYADENLNITKLVQTELGF